MLAKENSLSLEEQESTGLLILALHNQATVLLSAKGTLDVLQVEPIQGLGDWHTVCNLYHP